MRAEFITTRDARWDNFLKTVRHDFYHLPGYLDFCANHEGGTASAFYAREGDLTFLAPILIRPLPPELGAPSDWKDAITPYGYPSPLISGSADAETLSRILEAFQAAASAHNLVSAFFRLHPLLSLPLDGLIRRGDLRQHHGTVAIDLTLPLEKLERQTRKDHRRRIRKLKEAGFKAKLDDWDRMSDFIRVYQSTMYRVGATDFYIFTDDYFHDLRVALGDDRLHLVTVEAPDGDIACATMITTINNDIVQDHLGGSAPGYRRESPERLMTDFIRHWAKEAGYKVFHLGGGVGNSDDSLFHYKAGFSPLFKEFYTYRLILDKARYTELSAIWEAMNNAREETGTSDFFPLYRRPLPVSEE